MKRNLTLRVAPLVLSFLFLIFQANIFAQAQSFQECDIDLNLGQISQSLVTAPNEKVSKSFTSFEITLPHPDGTEKAYQVMESQIMDPEFAAAYPNFKSYALQSVENPAVTGRMTVTPYGLNATILSSGGIINISPEDLTNPVTHKVALVPQLPADFVCGFDDVVHAIVEENNTAGFAVSGTTNGDMTRTYDFAAVTTGEFYNTYGGTVAMATATVTAIVDALQAIYEVELAVKFNLLTPVIYTDPATDPFDATSTNRTLMAAEAVAMNWTVDQYDLGHAFHSSGGGSWGGGVAFFGLCSDGFVPGSGTGRLKAGAWSSVGGAGAGAISLVAHEVGHQFFMPHTFNGIGGSCTANISATSAYEIASGNTIMSYNGICQADNNIPSGGAADDYFHAHSLEQAVNRMNATTCATAVSSGNTPPTVNANSCGGTHTIPYGTPFRLTGTGTDADGDQIYYSWEQYDEDGAGTPTQGFIGTAAAASTIAPLFRSYPPTTNPTRTFPNINLVIANDYASSFEPLPTVGRTINFRLTGRDRKTVGGGIHCSDLAVMVDGAVGPFSVNMPNGGETWNAGSMYTVTWTSNALATNVNIKLSIDGGLTSPISLVSNTANDGTETFTLPATVPNSTEARVIVESADNDCVVFFDMSNANFTITSNCPVSTSNICPSNAMTVAAGAAANLSLAGHYGGTVSSYTLDINASSPTGPIANATTSGGTTCQEPWGTEKYNSFDFVPASTGSYTFSSSTANQLIYSIFEASGYNPASPCSGTFLGSNSTSAISWSGSATVTLNECTVYKLVVWTLFSANSTATVNVSGAGDVLESNSAPANTGYTFIAVNSATGVIAAESATSDFSGLGGGTYIIYGASYKNGGAASPPDVTPSSWVGQTLTAVQGSDCMLASTNSKQLTITGGASCPGLDATTAPAIGITNSTCPPPATTPSGGSFTAITCPAGSTAQYSTDNVNWSTTLPTYNQTTAMTVYTRCNCDADMSINSMTAMATTVPGTCAPDVCINEVDADTPGTDMMEFVELSGPANTALDGLVLVFFNGSNDQSYRAIDLDGQTTDANGFFVAGNAAVPGVDVIFPNNGLQNGADAVALYLGNDSDFPNNTPVTMTNLVDALVYDTNDGDDSGLLTGLGQTTQYNEDENNDKDNHSNSKVADCGTSVVAQTPTPDATNVACPAGLTTTTAPAVVVTESTCVPPATTPSGGVIAPPSTSCPTGSTLQYSTDNTNWSTTIPTYNQTTAITVYTRCNCDVDMTVNSITNSVTTVPGTCAPPCDAMITGVVVTDETCDGADDGSLTITATGTGTLEYQLDGGAWQSSNVFSGLADGTYSVTVRIVGTTCTATQGGNVVNAGATVSITSVDATHETCAGDDNGTLTVNATGSGTLEYQLDGGAWQSSNMFTGLADGTYSVTARVVGTTCTATQGGNVVNPGSDVQITGTSKTDESGVGANDGTITVNATCNDCVGTLEYSIGGAWQASNMFTGLAPNTYTITVRDNGNTTCVATTMVTINPANCDINLVSAVATDGACPSDPGMIVVTATCTTCTSIEYQLDAGAWQTSNTFSGVAAATYTVNVRDSGDPACNASTTATVNDPVDGTMPVAICQDITVSLDAGGNASATAADINNGSTDNCGIMGTAIDISTFNCSNIGTAVVVTLTVTDNSSNTATCTGNVTVEDNMAPVAMCMDATVNLDASSMGSITTTDIDNGSSDNCGAVSLSLDITMFDCGDLGANTVTMTADDGNGNTHTCTATVTVVDPGVANCITPMVSQTDEDGDGTPDIVDPCSCGDPLNLTTGTILYYHDFVTIVSNPGETWEITAITSGAMLDAGLNPIAVGTVIPETAPGVYHLDFWTQNTVGFAAEFNRTVNPLAMPLATGGTCTDNTPPTLSAMPGDVTLECSDVIPAAAALTATDDCAFPSPLPVTISEFHYDNTGGDTGEFVEVTGTAGTDLSIYQIVLYNGNGGGTYNTVNLSGAIDDEGAGFGAVSFAIAGIQNGAPDGIVLVESGVAVQFLAYEGSFVATNGPANGMNLPDIGVSEPGSTPVGQSLQFIGGAWTGPAVANAGDLNPGFNPLLPADNPGPVNATVTEVINIIDACNGTITRTWSATDAAGNTATHTQTITIEDNTAPVITGAPADAVIPCGDPVPTAPTLFGLDNCVNVPVAPWINEFHYDNTGADMGEFVEIAGSVGTDLTGWAIELYNGNGGAIYNTTPLSGIIPQQLNGYGTIFVPIAGIQNGAPDGIALVDNGTVVEFISYEGTMTATSGSANGMTSTDIGVFQPGSNPVMLSLQLMGSGSEGSDFTWSSPSAETPGDINSGQTFTGNIPTMFNESSVIGACNETITRTWSVADVCGNMNTHTQTITVENVVGPTAICQDITISLDVNGNGSITVNQIDNGSFDNCVGGLVLSASQTNFACQDIGQVTVVLTVENACGLADNCDAIVTVEDYLPLGSTMTCNDNVQVSLDAFCLGEVTPDMVLEENYGCFTHFFVELSDAAGAPLPNPITGDYIGETVIATVTSDLHDNSCWATVTLEDKFGPELICQTLTVDCDDDLPPVYNNAGPISQPLSGVASIDNCDPDPIISLVDEFYSDDDICDNDQKILTRTYISYDAAGNESNTCDVQIVINKIQPVFPADIEWECTTYAANNDVLNPENSGHPFENAGGNISNFEACNYAVAYADEVLGTCGYEASLESPVFKIVRVWTVLDWCTNTVITSNASGDNSQTIKVVDTNGPTVSMMPITVSANEVGIHPHPCTSTELIPAPGVLEDACTGVADLQIFTPNGEADYIGGNPFNGGTIPAPGLEVGTHIITYIATDGCGNTTEFATTVTVVDDIAPVAVCDEITEVNLSSDGDAELFAETLDDGSHDQCCLDYFEVRRMDASGCDDTLFGPSVNFCCDDVAASHTVVFRAWDCYGNYNDCMVQVIVNDKIDPWVTCPADDEITCNEYWDTLEADISLCNGDSDCISQVLTDAGYGTYTAWDNCEYIVSVDVSVNLDQCGEGSITRTFSVEDPSGNTGAPCTQTILVHHVSDFVVEFPADITAVCVSGEDVPDFGEPEVFFESCELVAVSYQDETFDVVADACYKIVRQWTVINWCVIGEEIDEEHLEDPENALGLPFPLCDLDGDGDCDDRTFRDSWSNGVYPDASNATDQFGPDSDPDTDPWDGYVTYQQVIKVVDNVAPTFPDGCAIDDVCIWDGCSTDVTLPSFGADDCSSDVTTIVESTSLPNGTGFGPYTDVVPGTYTVNYYAFDNCGNSTACATTVTVEDCKNPTPYCVEGLVIELMNTVPPMVDIWAVDFDAGSFDNCQVDCIAFSDDCSDTQMIFDCEDTGEQTIQIWVYDGVNWDFCETTVIIQDNMSECGVPLIAGNLATEDNEDVENVEVTINGTVDLTFTTDETGNYSVEVPSGGDYSVTPIKDINPLNGVTTFDLVKISKHILNIQLLDSPYKIIAADANKSNSVTTFDLVEIRKLILYINDNFSNNTSWRFIDEDYTFPDPTNPFVETFPEVLNFNNLETAATGADFVAVKVGDVNGNASTNQLLGADDRNTTGVLSFTAPNRNIKAGEQVSIDFTAENFNHSGYQFSIDFDANALEFVEVEAGLASEEHFGYSLLEEGILTTSWNSSNAVMLSEEDKIFTLHFVAKTNATLSNLISFNSRYTVAEAYNENDELQEVQLTFNNTGSVAIFDLYQNRPNPFKDGTTIGFNLPEAGEASITITDLSGKVIKVINGTYAKGYNEIILTKNDLGVQGVLNYQLKTSAGSVTKRMIIVD